MVQFSVFVAEKMLIFQSVLMRKLYEIDDTREKRVLLGFDRRDLLT